MIESLGLKRLPSSSSPPDPTSCVNRGLIKFTAGKKGPYVASLLMEKGLWLVKHTRTLLSSSIRSLSCVLLPSLPGFAYKLRTARSLNSRTVRRCGDGIVLFTRHSSCTFFSLLHSYFILFSFVATCWVPHDIREYGRERKREKDGGKEKKRRKGSSLS